MKKRRMWIWVIGIWAVFSLCAASIWAVRRSKVRMETIESYQCQDGIYYGINSIYDNYQIFMIDTNTGKSSWIHTPWIDPSTGESSYVKKMFAGDYGHGYLVLLTEDRKDLSIDIWDYDFLKHKRSRICSWKLDPQEVYVDISRRTGRTENQEKLFYLSTAVKNERNMSVTSREIGLDGTLREIQSGYVLPLNCISAEQRGDGTLIYQDVDGSVCKALKDGTSKFLYYNVGGKDHNANYIMGENICSFYNLNTEQYYTINCNTGKITIAPDPVAKQRNDIYRILHLQPDVSGKYAAVIMQSDYSTWPALITENGTQILSVQQPLIWIMQDLLLAASILFGAGMLLYGGYCLVCFSNHGVFPTALKLVCVAVPLAVAGYLLIAANLENMIRTEFWSREQERVSMMAELYAEKVDPKCFSSDYKGVEYAHQVEDGLRKIYPTTIKVNDRYGNTQQTIVHDWFSLSLYYQDHGEFYPMTDEGLICTPISYTPYGADASAMSRSVEEKRAVSVHENSITSGEMVVCCVPVWMDQTCVGVLRVRVDDIEIRKNVEAATLQAKQRIAFHMVCMLLVLLIVASVSLHPLRKMEAAVRDMAGGKRRVALKVREGGEIAEMQLVFNQMADNLGDYLDRTESLKKANEPFMPKEMIRLLGKKDVRSVEPGDEAVLQATVLVLQAGEFSELQPRVSAEEMFHFMDQALRLSIAAVVSEGGVIQRFEDAGITVLFTGDKNYGVLSAIRAAQKAMKSLREEKLSLNGTPISFTGGLAAGEVKLMAVGSDERMEILTVASCIHQAKVLSKQADEYGAELLITGTAVEKLEGFAAQPGNRLLGYIRLDEEERNEPVYEIFNTGEDGEASPKQRTKFDFAVGVMAFEEREWKSAKEIFAAILKDNVQDKAAGQYFTICDQYMEQEEERDETGVDV